MISFNVFTLQLALCLLSSFSLSSSSTISISGTFISSNLPASPSSTFSSSSQTIKTGTTCSSNSPSGSSSSGSSLPTAASSSSNSLSSSNPSLFTSTTSSKVSSWTSSSSIASTSSSVLSSISSFFISASSLSISLSSTNPSLFISTSSTKASSSRSSSSAIASTFSSVLPSTSSSSSRLISTSSPGSSLSTKISSTSSSILPITSSSSSISQFTSTSSSRPSSSTKISSISSSVLSSTPSSSFQSSSSPRSSLSTKISSISSTHSTSSSKSSITSSITSKSSIKPSPTTSSAILVTTGAPKRGLVYNTTSKYIENWNGNGSQVSWAYNWDSIIHDTFPRYLEFVPMLWGPIPVHTGSWFKNANYSLATGSGHLLAFNEPDACGPGQSCISPANAAAAYRTWMMPYAKRAALGAPAVTNGPSGLPWLTEFLGNCTGCKIDFVPLHWYNRWNNTGYLHEYLEAAYIVAGGRNLWLTEFNASGNTTEQITFLKEAIPWMDARPWISRYSWYLCSPYSQMGSIVDENGLPTDLGSVYAYTPF